MTKSIFKKKITLNCRGQLMEIDKPLVMGILNITPDSFYDGGKYADIQQIKQHIIQMLHDGASIIDIGAHSSRPGAKHISIKEEIERLEPVLNLILKEFPETIVSVDTFRAEIAEIVVNDYAVSVINDISAGELDKKMFETIASLNIPYILMHLQGTPQNMQENPVYHDVVEDIFRYFSKKLVQLRKLGVHDIILDPGFGFGKTVNHNYKILNHLSDFSIFGLPILTGLSRKSMIYKFLQCTPDEALIGTSVLNTIALGKGVSILRVHDVKEARQTINLYLKTFSEE